jgi:UDP-N-acetylglucosamine--N-acetylmuramyl-(pentapeptide) pyrophosphoryl-undecaprenol N-acetylglucosamine transferase
MRLVVSGGGTGGHIYPALMIAEHALQEEPNGACLYIGTVGGLESKIVPKTGIPFETIEISGFRRSLSFENVRTVVRFLRGVRRAKQLLREFKPDVVVGTGGYVCAPVVYAAAKMGIPTMIHEQNAIPGLSNAFLSRYVNCVAVSFRQSLRQFRRARNVVYTGNPRASAVVAANADAGRKAFGIIEGTPIVLIFGGSRGALALNNAVLDMLPLMAAEVGIQFIYVTGEYYHERVIQQIKGRIETLPAHIHVVPYVYNMPEVLSATSLMIGRAGASSLAELTALGIPSILIPSPNVTNNHQEKNALALVEAGAAEMIRETELSGSLLFERMKQIMRAPQRMKSMAQQAKNLGQPNAMDLLFAALRKIIG